MSLRVDLISQNEKRSGSSLSIKTFSRIGKIIVPLVIIFAVGFQFLNFITMSNQLRMLESRWKSDEPKQNQARNLASQLQYNITTAKELEAWEMSRIELHEQILAIIETTPESIQATSLILSSDSIPKALPSPPLREMRLTIDGKNSGRDAMDFIETFRDNLENHSSITGIVKSIEVTNYEADTSDDADELDRIFQIECIYKSRPLKEKK